jgi:hypothetical protein
MERNSSQARKHRLALLGNIAKRAQQGQYAITFQRPYLVDLCVGSGGAFTKEPLSIKGFVLGESPSGVPSVLKLIASDGKKVKLLVVLVTEHDGEWRLEKTALGWNRDLTRDQANHDPSSRHVEFKEDGVFLVVLRPNHEGVVPMPLAIHSIVVNDQGNVLKAKSKDGGVFQPEPKPVDLDVSLLPSALDLIEGDGEYKLAPAEKPKQQSGAPLTSSIPNHTGADSTLSANQQRKTPLETREFRMELALRGLLVREKRHTGKERVELLDKILLDSIKKASKSETPLTDVCKHLVLAVGGNAKANLLAGLCRKWIQDHNDRTLWKELVWKNYYQDLTDVAPLLCSLESDLNRADTSAYDRKLEERRKR